MRRIATLFTLTCITGSAAAYPITYVEPKSTVDCSSHLGHLANFGAGTVGTGNNDFDADGRADGSTAGSPTPVDEDNDDDRVFETLAAALAETDTGGIIYVLPGIYHEKVTVSDSVTIRGLDRDTVIFDATCLGTNGKAIDVTGTGKTVNVENLTILGYTNGIWASDSALNVTNCRIEGSSSVGIYCPAADLNVTGCKLRGNATGIYAPSSGYKAHIVDTEIVKSSTAGITGDSGVWYISRCSIRECSRGIDMNSASGTNVLVVDDCKLLDNTNEGVRFTTVASSCQLSVHRSQVVGNGGDGISLTSRSSGSLRVTDSLVEANGDDGIAINNNAGCVSCSPEPVPLRGIVRNCRILGNVGDGIDASGSGTGCFGGGTCPSSTHVSVMDNTIAFNGGWALRTTTAQITCSLGHNQITHNALGTESSGLGACATSGTSVNHVP